ncbi:hypothetical protein FACS1894182_11350 [Bacteroidia bacterium]|nr:hypothetical protein FACS1894182_11350 [Bacteroidia bacterium]
MMNDMPANHPLRHTWINIITAINYEVNHNVTSYINGGFCGISIKNIEFIYLWKTIIDYAVTKCDVSQKYFAHTLDFYHPFRALDQDALNIAAMATKVPISEYGQEGMDFIHGGSVMSHAVCSPKPWKKRFLISAIQGKGPSLADKQYWNNATGLLNLYSKWRIRKKRISIKVASFISRFYKRS